MKCVATIKNGNIESIDKVSDGYTRNGSCIDIVLKGKGRTFEVKKGLKDGVYYCPKELWKQKVRDLGKAKVDTNTVAETKATKTKKAKKEAK